MENAKTITVITDMIPKIKLHLHQLKEDQMDRFINVTDEESEKMQFEPEYYNSNTFTVEFPEHLANRLMEQAMNRDRNAITDPSALNYSITVVCMKELIKFIEHHLEDPYNETKLITYNEKFVRPVAVGDVMEMLFDDNTVWYMYDNQSDFIGLNGVKTQ